MLFSIAAFVLNGVVPMNLIILCIKIVKKKKNYSKGKVSEAVQAECAYILTVRVNVA